MNNEAFQKLVRAGVKTSKQIAREAVLEEARSKGKRGRGGRKNDDDYSSDEDYNKKSKKKQRQQQQVKEKELDSEEEERLAHLSKKYRDRARERREGRAAGIDQVAAASAAATTTKSASETIFDDVVEALETGNRQKLAQLRTTTNEHDDNDDAEEYHPPSTAQEALDWINDNAMNGGRARPPTSELGKEMLRFLTQQYSHAPSSTDHDNDTTTVSAAGRRLQHSVWTFRYCQDNLAVVGEHCWEPPTERTYAAAETTSTATGIQKGTDCPAALLATMERSLQRMQQQEQKKQHASTEQSSSKKGKSRKKKKKPEGAMCNPDDKEGDEAAAAAAAAENDSKSEDDDDDDIFGGVGDYDGARAIQEGADEQEDSAGVVEKKGSIFGDESATKTSTQAKVTAVASASAQERTKPSTTISTRLVGFASINNDDNEDDGIGMDFDGRDYEDDEDRKKKKKKKRKKGGDDDSDDD